MNMHPSEKRVPRLCCAARGALESRNYSRTMGWVESHERIVRGPQSARPTNPTAHFAVSRYEWDDKLEAATLSAHERNCPAMPSPSWSPSVPGTLPAPARHEEIMSTLAFLSVHSPSDYGKQQANLARRRTLQHPPRPPSTHVRFRHGTCSFRPCLACLPSYPSAHPLLFTRLGSRSTPPRQAPPSGRSLTFATFSPLVASSASSLVQTPLIAAT